MITVAARVGRAASFGAGWSARAARVLARAVRVLPPRHWAAAAAIGAAYGGLIAIVAFLSIMAHRKPGTWLGTIALMSTRWSLLMTAVVCALAVGIALMNDAARRGPVRPRRVVLTMAGALAVGAVVDPLAVHLADVVHSALDVQTDFFTHGSPDWWAAVTRGWALSMDQVFSLVSVATLSSLFLIKTATAADALVAMQVRLDQARRARLGGRAAHRRGRDRPRLPVHDARLHRRALRPRRGDRPAAARRDDPLPEGGAALARRAGRNARSAGDARSAHGYLDVQSLRTGGRISGKSPCPASCVPGSSRRH